MVISGAEITGGTEPLGQTGRWFDNALIWAVCGVGAMAALFLLFVPSFHMPAEDAIILFQFSHNLAHTGAITYIPNGPHAEGATDFAWMLLISAAIKLRIEPFWMVAAVNFISMLLFGCVLARIAGRRVSVVATLFAMGGFALVPQFWSAVAGFSTLPFACLLLLLTRAVLEEEDVAAPLWSLLLCLFRPDGVVFAIPLLMAGLIAYPAKRRRLGLDFALFVLPGIVYFLWRWHYFGEMLPLPFLVKSDAVRLGHYLVVASLMDARNLLLFTLVVLSFVLHRRMNDIGNRIVLVCLIVLPTIFYLGMRLDQDVGRRFFIYLPVGLAVLIARNWSALLTKRAMVLRVGLAAWLFCVATVSAKEGHGEAKSFQMVNRRDVSSDLAQLPHGTLLTTEAGIAPYYSGWTTYDSWGLNTAQFARHIIQPGDVVRLNTDLVLIHNGRPPVCSAKPGWQVPHVVRTWDNMAQNMIEGIDPNHYELWYVPRADGTVIDRGVKASEVDWDCWYVRKDSPMRVGVEEDLSSHHGMMQAQFEALLASEDGSSGVGNPVENSRKPSVLGRIKNVWHKL